MELPYLCRSRLSKECLKQEDQYLASCVDTLPGRSPKEERPAILGTGMSASTERSGRVCLRVLPHNDCSPSWGAVVVWLFQGPAEAFRRENLASLLGNTASPSRLGASRPVKDSKCERLCVRKRCDGFIFALACGRKRTKRSSEMLWVRTAQQLSSNNPLPESVQTIHEKIYAEEKTKRIRFSDWFGDAEIISSKVFGELKH